MKRSQFRPEREVVVKIDGDDLKIKYNPAFMTQDYVDVYADYRKGMLDPDNKESIRFKLMLEYLSKMLTYIDFQDESGSDIPTTLAGLTSLNLDLATLQEINKAINDDINARSAFLGATEADSSTGSSQEPNSTPAS